MARDPDSECSPIIDLWYDIHLHFLLVPSDYLFPPANRFWLSLV